MEEASYLMDRPAGGWSELVTNHTLDLKLAVIEAQIDALRARAPRRDGPEVPGPDVVDDHGDLRVDGDARRVPQALTRSSPRTTLIDSAWSVVTRRSPGRAPRTHSRVWSSSSATTGAGHGQGSGKTRYQFGDQSSGGANRRRRSSSSSAGVSAADPRAVAGGLGARRLHEQRTVAVGEELGVAIRVADSRRSRRRCVARPCRRRARGRSGRGPSKRLGVERALGARRARRVDAVFVVAGFEVHRRLSSVGSGRTGERGRRRTHRRGRSRSAR